MDKVVQCYYSNKTSLGVHLHGTFYLVCTDVVLTLKSVDKILCFYHVNESSLAEHLNRTIFVQRNNERNLAAIRHKG